MSDNLIDLQKENWMTSKWRPAMAWMYMAVCIFDFIIFPIMWSVIQVIFNGKVDSPWAPMTLMGAGLFHMAMGAVIGVTAWGRTQEKLNVTTETNENVPVPEANRTTPAVSPTVPTEQVPSTNSTAVPTLSAGTTNNSPFLEAAKVVPQNDQPLL